MPIYEYRCAECGFQDEYLQKVSEPPMSVCPSCGKASFAKLLSAAGFQLKGSGWYATDFRNSGREGRGEIGREGRRRAGERTGRLLGLHDRLSAQYTPDRPGASRAFLFPESAATSLVP